MVYHDSYGSNSPGTPNNLLKLNENPVKDQEDKNVDTRQAEAAKYVKGFFYFQVVFFGVQPSRKTKEENNQCEACYDDGTGESKVNEAHNLKVYSDLITLRSLPLS